VFKETSVEELTKANCYPRHSCSKLLLIDVIVIWYLMKIVFTLTTVKI